MIEVGLVLFRALHYATSLGLFGLMLFPLYTYPLGVRRAPGIDAQLRAITAWASLAVLVSGVLWFANVVASITDGLPGRDAISSVLTNTSFGAVSIGRLVLIALILVLIAVRRAPAECTNRLAVVLCAGLLASLAALGHTQMSDEGIDRTIHTIADGLHLLAAGAWLGGLVALFLLVGSGLRSCSPGIDVEARNAAQRFSAIGYTAVATLIGSGLINSWFLVGPPANLTSTPYGKLLLVKLVLFAGMVGLAAWNRFVIVPRLSDAPELGAHDARLRQLRRHVIAEQALGVLVVLAVSALGTIEPAINNMS